MADGDSSASARALRVGSMVFSTRSSVSSSNFARVSVMSRCFGPVASAVINGRLMLVVVTPDNSILAFSAASFSLWAAILSLRRSMPLSRLNSAAIQSMTRWSKSSPPRRLLPLVARTSNTPSAISRMDTSKVPPPRSNTRIFCSFSLSRP